MTNVTQDIRYIGVNDHQLDLFEGQYDVPNGMAYNSYVILDEKIAVMDSPRLCHLPIQKPPQKILKIAVKSAIFY